MTSEILVLMFHQETKERLVVLSSRRGQLCGIPSKYSPDINMRLRLQPALRWAALAFTLWLFIGGPGYAQNATPFGRVAGQWSGSGTIELVNGAREPIKCRASYDVLDELKKLQLNIRCASESYNFDLRSSANYNAGAVTGSWSESTRNVAGTISGKAEGDRFQVLATSASFSATLTLITHGNRQAVTIKSREDNSTVKAVSLTLQRGK